MKQKLIVLAIICLWISASTFAQTEYKTPRIRVSASGGLGYLVASSESANINGVINPDAINSANKKLRWAKHLNGDVHYLLNNGWGLGAKYIFQKTSTEVNEVIIELDDYVHYGVANIWERDYVNFVGPSLFGYSTIGNRNNLILTSSLSAGYAWFRSEASVLSKNVLITGANIGMNTELGIDYLFNPNFGLGANLGYLLTTFSKITITDGMSTQEATLNKDMRYNASNFHFSVGLRYYFNK